MQSKPAATPPYTFGGVVFDDDGRVLLIEPKDHFDGYAWTFPKGLPHGNQAPEEAATYHVRKDTGYSAPVIACIPGTYRGGTSEAIFFLMRCVGRADAPAREADAVATAWATPEDARARINMTTNDIGRARDLALLEAALAFYADMPREWLTRESLDDESRLTEAFARKLLAMVAELHHRGYESLRIVPGLSPSGTSWRFELVPASRSAPEGGALLRRGGPRNYPCYTTADGLGAFGWPDAAARSEAELADRAEGKLSALLSKCRTPDPEYVRWFQEMLDASAPLGLPVAYADMRMRPDSLYVVGHCPIRWIPTPPPPRPVVPEKKRNVDPQNAGD